MNPLDSSELLKARDRLLSGDVVAIPTETVYGLAASIDSDAGLRKVFALKERPFFDPLIVHVSSLKEAASVVKEWPPLADFVARMFWPGPLTLVLPKADRINPLITSGLDTVAVRYPAHPLAQELIRLTGTPLAAPSANKFGRTSPSSAEHVRTEFTGHTLQVIDGGECEVGIESTVVAFGKGPDGEDELQILRPGGITEEMLKEKLQKWFGATSVRRMASEASPGHLKHHYMPKIPLVIVSEDEPSGLFRETKKRIQEELGLAQIRTPMELNLNEEAPQAARELYGEMRRQAESGADLLYVRRRKTQLDQGLWQAIWDRLTRAASLDLDSGA
jgi:L-threonylcarbamoyladenylate synthase